MGAPSAVLEGVCDPRFERVRDAFERNFAEQDEIGAAVAVVLDGRPVVDLWGGWLDRARTRPWGRDAIVNIWSVGKAVAAICLLRLVALGRVDVEAPVARYWPEFAQAGKSKLTVRQVLSHQAGLPAIAKPLPPGINLTSWETMATALAEQEPWWEPGTRFGYHTNTFGFLVGELVRRVDGRRIADYLQEEVAGPLGVDFFFGFGPEHDRRVAEWIAYERPPGEASDRPPMTWDPAELQGIELCRVLAYRNPPSDMARDVNSRVWRASEYPSTSGHSNARAIAAILGDLVAADARLLGPETVERAIQVESDGEDTILRRPNRFGLGFQLTIPGVRAIGLGPRCFGHYGNGGLVGFADPDARLGFGYVANRGGRSWRDPRNIALIDAVYASL